MKLDFHLRMTIFLMDSEIIRKTKFPERDVSVYSLIGLEIFQYLPKGCCFWRNLLIYIKSIYFMYIIHSMWSSQCKTCSFRDSALNKRLLKLLLCSSNTHLTFECVPCSDGDSPSLQLPPGWCDVAQQAGGCICQQGLDLISLVNSSHNDRSANWSLF